MFTRNIRTYSLGLALTLFCASTSACATTRGFRGGEEENRRFNERIVETSSVSENGLDLLGTCVMAGEHWKHRALHAEEQKTEVKKRNTLLRIIAIGASVASIITAVDAVRRTADNL